MLVLEDIVAHYGQALVLQGVSLEVKEGRVVCLLGANGAGKTTTLRTILGLLRPTEGVIRLRGRRIDGMKTHEIIRNGIATVPEGRRIFPKLTTRDNLRTGALLVTDRVKAKGRIKTVCALFPRLGERLDQVAGTLSGGEQAMLAIARALMSEPQLILLDEPSLGLAPTLVEELFEIIQQINRQGTTVFLIEQNAAKALSIADRGYVLEKGRVVACGAARELQESEHIHRAYLRR